MSSDTGLSSLPRWQPGEPGQEEVQDALLAGTLAMENGCLVVRTSTGQAYAVRWPPHVELARGTQGVEVRDSRTGAVARVGGAVTLTGGEVPASAGTRGDLPPGCPESLWLAGGVQGA